ncbi:hypothetical protein ACA097_10105 [Pseudomonas sp. QL9]|uniref:hypothetical protein n=1 Tax=Pseudomonas sp. QL9 TaxID=3242725 RepID=UPI00352A7BC9
MEISGNAFSTGLQGLNRSLQQVDRAASRLAAQPAASSADDLTAPLVDMQQAKYAALANSRTLQVADQTLGTLIDISV